MPNDIISLTEFKNDASGWALRLQKQPPVVLTQNGKGVLVVQSLDAYQRTLDGLVMAQIGARATQDIAAGRTYPHELVVADVFALIDTIEESQRARKPAEGQAPRSRPKPPAGAKRRPAATKARG